MLLAVVNGGTSGSGSADTWIWIVVGILTLLGVGGLAGIYRWIKRQGLLEDQDVKVRLMILGDGTRENPPLSDRLNHMIRSETANGAVGRTEAKVDKLQSSLEQHLGRSEAEHEDMRRRMSANEGRIAAIERKSP